MNYYYPKHITQPGKVSMESDDAARVAGSIRVYRQSALRTEIKF